MLELGRRVVIFATFLLFLAGIALVCVALATDHWILAHPQRNVTGAEVGRESVIHSGLFKGVRKLDSGLGPRVKAFNVRAEMGECTADGQRCAGFMSKGLWVTVILFAVLGALWAAIGVVFALTNTVIRPVHTVAGPLGLYLWSALAALCTMVSVALFLVQFFTRISESVLLPDFHADYATGFVSTNLTSLSWSFFLMVGALGAFCLNILLLLLSGLNLSPPRGEKEAPHLSDRGVLMY